MTPPDLAHVMGADLALTASGDLATVTGADETQQRVLHRLLTNLGGYVWQLGYGASLPTTIGTPIAIDTIRGIVVQQMRLEAGVDQTQPITVTATTDNIGTDTVSVGYVDAVTGMLTGFTLP